MKIKCHILLDVEIEFIGKDSEITDSQIKHAIREMNFDPGCFCNIEKISYLAADNFPAVSLPNEFKL